MSTVVSSPWSTWVLCLVIAAVALIRGHFGGTLVIALLALAVVGAVFPPVGFLFAGVIAFYLLAVHGVEGFGHLAQLFGGKQQ